MLAFGHLVLNYHRQQCEMNVYIKLNSDFMDLIKINMWYKIHYCMTWMMPLNIKILIHNIFQYGKLCCTLLHRWLRHYSTSRNVRVRFPMRSFDF